MKIKEILDDLLITGNTIAKIAKEKVHIGEKKLKEALHNAGYEYRNSGQKGWHYVGEGEEPLYTSVFEFIKSNNSHPKVKQATPAYFGENRTRRLNATSSPLVKSFLCSARNISNLIRGLIIILILLVLT
jgi:hypothetical protein